MTAATRGLAGHWIDYKYTGSTDPHCFRRESLREALVLNQLPSGSWNVYVKQVGWFVVPDHELSARIVRVHPASTASTEHKETDGRCASIPLERRRQLLDQRETSFET